ncbi:MAG: DNA-protecting protein DprA, partial [Methylotenera sp.]|nr:DNA-protecting protein DprA [Methylotenera sp.]
IVEELKLSAKLDHSIKEIDAENSATNLDHQTTTDNTILKIMGFEPIALEQIVSISGLTVGEVSSMLMLLELEGKLTSLAGGQYQKLV